MAFTSALIIALGRDESRALSGISCVQRWARDKTHLVCQSQYLVHRSLTKIPTARRADPIEMREQRFALRA
jgi:hypothetical protein